MSSPASIEKFRPLTVVVDRPATAKRDKLSLSTGWLDVATVRISGDGEIDASNVADLAEHVFARIGQCRQLILDLQMVKFLGVECVSTLFEIDARCATATVSWTLVASGSVSRVLDICDPDGLLPLTDT